MPNYINQMMFAELCKEFQGIASCVFVDPQGISVEEANNLRASMGEWNVRFQVVKNSIALKALVGAGVKGVDEFLQGPTGIAYGTDEDAIHAVKVITKFSTAAKQLKLKGAYLSGEILPATKVGELADIPTKEELYSMILGGVVNLITVGPTLVNSLLSQPAYLTNAFIEKKGN